MFLPQNPIRAWVAAILMCCGAAGQNIDDLTPLHVKVDAVEYQGRQAIRLTKEAEGDGLALLRGAPFQDGTIEADVAVRLTTAPGTRNPGFIGIGFRSRPDAAHYEMFYIRPGNSAATDQAMRNHSVQYVSAPDYDWYRLRRSWPWTYEAYADFQLETWIPIRIEVSGRGARLYVNGARNPALVVDGLKGEDLKGAVGLWGSPGQESYFSNVRIHRASPAAFENGVEAAGAWDVHYSSDVGNYDCVLILERKGGRVSGVWSGMLGSETPVSGSWRDGYLEVALQGTWAGRDPGEVSGTLAGWIEGDAAKGRLIVNGRADGQWTATRRKAQVSR